MASFPAIEFPNNEIPSTFNKNTFETKIMQSDNILTSSLDVLGPSTLNTLTSNTITNTGLLTSNTITSTGALSSGSITNTGALTSNTITSTNLLTASNGLTVTTGTISAPANSIFVSSVNNLSTLLAQARNPNNGSANNATITANNLTIDYAANNNQTIFVVPTANFNLFITNVPTTNLYGMYTLNIRINARFFVNGPVTVNGNVISTIAENGISNIVINPSAVLLYQTFKNFFVNNTVPTRVLTEVTSFW